MRFINCVIESVCITS